MARPQVMVTCVPPGLLRSRIDPAFYAPEHLERERRLQQLGVNRPAISQMASLVTDGTHKTPTYVLNGVPFLSATNIDSGALVFSDHKFVPRFEFLQLRAWNCAPLPNDVVVAKSGSIGNAAVVPSHAPEFAVFESVAIVRCEHLDAYYLATFLNSTMGQKEIKRQTKGAVIRHLHLEDLREVEVPDFIKDAQRYIGDKVRQAERLGERARTVSRAACALVEALIEQRVSGADLLSAQRCGAPAIEVAHQVFRRQPQPGATLDSPGPSRRFSRIASITMSPERMDSSYYAPRFLENERLLSSCGTTMVPIASLADKCNCGSTPVEVSYDGRGVGLIRTSDVRPNAFLGHQVLRTSELRLARDSSVAAVAEDLVYTMSGTIGYAAVIPPTDEVFSFSNTIVRARFSERSGQDPWFTAAFFNSKYGYMQSLRLVSGGIQGHVMPNPFKKLLVPAPDSRAQRYIGDQFRYSDACASQARALVRVAKLLVEHLVEGRMTEAELGAAQKALEAGNRGADRDILTCCRQDHAPDAKPLIPDLDGLYALLDESVGGNH